MQTKSTEDNEDDNCNHTENNQKLSLKMSVILKIQSNIMVMTMTSTIS